MDEIITIDMLKAGQNATVLRLNTKGDMRRRFIDLGLIEGTDITCVGKSPLGDPSAFLIRGAVIAIRSEDASTVEAVLTTD
ncbi:MAG: ferrous iron transport protein A [Ruminococcaceae bacterium]|nr:ferrous iron transport protein A [Oscillospiraceae bacterium]